METDDQKETGQKPMQLQYAPATPKKGLSTAQKLLIAVGAIMVISSCFLESIYSGLQLVGLLGGAMVFFVVIGMRLIAACMEPRRTEEQDDWEWEERKRRRADGVALARQSYANGLADTWRKQSATLRQYGAPTLWEERKIQFLTDGTGMYRWYRKGNPLLVETIFRHRMDPEHGLLVQVSSPVTTEWVAVECEFAAEPEKEGAFRISVELEGENPLPPDFKEYWPFWGGFARVGEPLAVPGVEAVAGS